MDYHRREIIVRAQSYFTRLPKYCPPIPLSAQRVCPPSATKGVHTRRAERGMGGGGVNILEDERNRIALLQWSLYDYHHWEKENRRRGSKHSRTTACSLLYLTLFQCVQSIRSKGQFLWKLNLFYRVMTHEEKNETFHKESILERNKEP
jgi:hypothetical protein